MTEILQPYDSRMLHQIAVEIPHGNQIFMEPDHATALKAM